MPLNQLIFFPDRSLPDPPPGVEERWFTAADGVRLHAWYAAAPNAPATLVWSHGNGGNIGGRAEVLLALRAAGLSVLAYDYRGYGRSDGRPSERGVYLDAEAAYDSERSRGVSASRIVCFGESLGGAVSIYLATQRPCAGVAVVSTFTTLGDVAWRHYGPLAVFAGTRFDSQSRIAKLDVPVLIAHGDRGRPRTACSRRAPVRHGARAEALRPRGGGGSQRHLRAGVDRGGRGVRTRGDRRRRPVSAGRARATTWSTRD